MFRHVKIESMAFKGMGVGRIDGKTIFVPFTLVGDEVAVEIIQDKKTYFWGELKKIIVPSPHRIKPPCPYFGKCGGCQWQHIDPSIHGEMKREILWDILKRLGKLDPVPPIHVLPSLNPYDYRIRVQLKVKEKVLGYYHQGSHRFIEITHCPISHPLVNRMISILREQRDDFPSLDEIEINVSPEEEKGILLFHPHLPGQELRPFAKKLLQDQPLLKGVVISGKRESISIGDPSLLFSIPFPVKKSGLSFRISAGSFFQINLEQNQKLIRTVVDCASPTKDERLLDLYAGVGNFTLPLALHAGEVWGIEGNTTAITDAQCNVERNGIRNVHFVNGKVEEVLRDWKRGKIDQIVLDPPRAGCKNIIDRLTDMAPEKIVYVSCDPATFSRDISLFLKRGYVLQRLHLIDMFPQTYHMEVVGLLLRS